MTVYRNPFWEPVFAELFPITYKIYVKSPSIIKRLLARFMLWRITKREGYDV